MHATHTEMFVFNVMSTAFNIVLGLFIGSICTFFPARGVRVILPPSFRRWRHTGMVVKIVGYLGFAWAMWATYGLVNYTMGLGLPVPYKIID